MLLELWEWALLINDGIDLIFSNLASGAYPIPLSFIFVFLLFGFLSFFAWRSTDIPNLPEAPQPPYLIQITAGPGSGGVRQTISDVRLLSGGTYLDGNEILNRYHQNLSRNAATNTDASAQPSTSSNPRNGNRSPVNNVRGRIPGRSLLLGLFRRQNSLAHPVPAIPNAIRAQLSPNLVVYHRVNVYHHHIHSHLPTGGGTSASPTSVPPPTGDTVPDSSSSQTSPQTLNDPVDNVTTGNSDERSFTAAQNQHSETSGNSSGPIPVNNPEDDMPARSGNSAQCPPGDPANGEDVHFTIKFLNDTQMDVTSQMNEKIADFKRRHFATEMAENKTVRLIFNGRVLDNENKTLREFGIFDQCVVHCLIVNRQQTQDQSRSSGMPQSGRNNNPGHGEGVPGNVRRIVGFPEPGMFFVAFIGIFLIFLWFICLHFGQHLFTQSAVVSLTVLTAIFLIGIVACYLPLPAN